MMRTICLIIGTACLMMSCKKAKLDALAFPSKQLDAYEFEAYDAGDGAVPEVYAINADKRTLVTMTSTDKNAGEAYTIYGVYIGNIDSIATDTVIMYCHGQSAHMDLYWPRASLLANIVEKYHYGVFMMDYRGYGRSEGTPTEQALYDDVDASIDWLISKGAEQTRTFYYGFSLGCIPVINRAADRTDFKPAKIILESPLASVENLGNSSLIINVDPAFVSTLVFDNAEKIKSVDAPLYWLHGVEDDYIAIQNGELVYANHSGSFKIAERVAQAGHSDIPKVLGYTNYLNGLEGFLKE